MLTSPVFSVEPSYPWRLFAVIIFSHLVLLKEASAWLSAVKENVHNERVEQFFTDELEGHNVHRRMTLYNKNVENDRDRVRVHGRC